MEIKTLEGVGVKEILNTFNKAFADYFISIDLTEALLLSKMKADKTDLGLSVGVFDQGELVAFMLHGVDNIAGKQVVYNGGTGVVPEKRGAGLTKQMYQYILPQLIDQGVSKLKLEVIVENAPAIQSYKKSGYEVTREVGCFQGEVGSLQRNDSLQIEPLEKYDWPLMESFWDIQPTWQNSTNVLNTIKDQTAALGAYFNEQLVGYLIITPTSHRIHQIAVHKDFRQQGVASTLISNMVEMYGPAASIINVDKRAKAVYSFLEAIGLAVNFEQLEMELQL